MYDIHFRRYINTPNDYGVIAENVTFLEQARHLHRVSGDLVVYHGTKIIVNDPTWLWDWEKNTPTSYAHKAMKTGLTPEEMVHMLKYLGG